MPATAATLVRQQERMRICLQASSNTLTLRGNLRFAQTMQTDGELQFSMLKGPSVPPVSQHGDVADFIGKFGSADQLGKAENQLQILPHVGCGIPVQAGPKSGSCFVMVNDTQNVQSFLMKMIKNASVITAQKSACRGVVPRAASRMQIREVLKLTTLLNVSFV
jgi:hypothetical protein